MTDSAYKTFNYRLQNGGISCRYAYDRLPPGKYLSLQNVESREEGTLSSRYGITALSVSGGNAPLGAPVTTLGRMKGLSNPYNYAQAGAKLFRKNIDGPGSYGAAINSSLSGNRMSMAPYRPNNNANPYMFLADDDILLKDSGTVCNNWGISPPTQPAFIIPVIPDLVDIELCDEANTSSFTLVNLGSSAITGRVSASITLPITSTGTQLAVVNTVGASLVRAGGTTTATVFGGHGFVSGMRVSISGAIDPAFNVASAVITVTGVTTFTFVNPGANTTNGGTVSPLPSFQIGMSVTTTDGNVETVYITEVTTTGFVANFTKTHAINTGVAGSYLSGTVAANTTATISKADNLNLSFTNIQDQPDNNLIQAFILASNPLALLQVTLLFDVGDGTFTQDYYSAAVSMSPAQPVASGTVTSGSVQTSTVAQRAAGGVSVSTVGGNNPSLLPSDYPLLQQLQPSVLNPGVNPWTLIQVRLADFVANGAAGGPNNNWTDVVAWRIQIQTQATLTTTVGFDDIVFVGGSDLDSFAGQAYEYRCTYYNINTGCESGPSEIMVATDPSTFGAFIGANLPIPLAVQRLGIQVTPLQPTDPQVTHIRIYRRGGSLTQAWYFVTQIATGTVSFLDTIADSIIEINNTLVVDADAPVTTELPTPLNGTFTVSNFPVSSIGPGVTTGTLSGGTAVPGQLVTVGATGTQEQAYVQTVVGNVVTLYLQLNHGSAFHASVSTPMTASTLPQTPMNLMAIAFDKAWLAGDPNNPHVLYYSTTFQPETFPVENSLEIGTPDSPIMALVELQGLLFVFTTKRVYEILGAGSAVPTVIPTGVKHGLAAQFAWCVAEGTIYYLSYDGIYAFRGGQSTYLTEAVEWIWTGKNLGPVPAIDLTQKPQILLAYWNHEIFCRYVDQSGNSHRLISHETYGYRWRNDDIAGQSITAMFFAEDTGELFIGANNGMVYQDRVGDNDAGAPISYTIQSAYMDQSEVDPTNSKRSKIYNELTIDFDSAGQTVAVTLSFDGGAKTIAMGNISSDGRGQVQLNVNNGEGQEALNVSIILTGQATTAVTFYEVNLRAVVQAESRRSWDTWWMGQGVDEWKIAKQIFAEYRAPDPAGIFVNVYTDGNMNAPAFSFTLPQTQGKHRTANKVRFPATKYRLIRFIGTSASDFHMYDDTQIENKKLGAAKGYERSKISP